VTCEAAVTAVQLSVLYQHIPSCSLQAVMKWSGLDKAETNKYK